MKSLLTEFPLAHVVDINGQRAASRQVDNSETEFEIEMTRESCTSSDQHQKCKRNVRWVRFHVEVRVTSMVQF